MMSQIILRRTQIFRHEIRRNIAVTGIKWDTLSDQMEKVFLEKIAEYKSKSVNGKFVDPTPEIEAEFKSELQRIAKKFDGGEGQDLNKFPNIIFEDVKLDPIRQTD